MRRFSKAKEAKLAKLIAKGLEQRGATTVPDPYRPRYAIETKAGTLTVTPMAGWIACRFEDVERAKAVLGSDDRLNRWSGKWNHMFDASMSPESMAANFFAELSRIVEPNQAVPETAVPDVAEKVS